MPNQIEVDKYIESWLRAEREAILAQFHSIQYLVWELPQYAELFSEPNVVDVYPFSPAKDIEDSALIKDRNDPQ